MYSFFQFKFDTSFKEVLRDKELTIEKHSSKLRKYNKDIDLSIQLHRVSKYLWLRVSILISSFVFCSVLFKVIDEFFRDHPRKYDRSMILAVVVCGRTLHSTSLEFVAISEPI